MTSMPILPSSHGDTAVGLDAHEDHRFSRLWACAEITLMVVLFFVFAGTPPPDVNEAHYVAKAKHYWDPDWCPHDHFLNAADAHLMFYWAFGWLTLFFDLPSVTWIGRVITWVLLAWSWRRLSVVIVPARLYAPLGAALFATLMQWGHMAGEWVIGGVEAKGFAYVLIFLALEAFLRNRWRRAIILLGGATAFHVIAGGWTVVAMAGVWAATNKNERPSLRSLLPACIVSGILALIGLIPGLALSWSVDPEIVSEANRIYVFERLSHHLLFHALPHVYVARHAALLVVWVGFIFWSNSDVPEPARRLRRLQHVVAGAVIIAIVGIVLDQSLLYFRATAASVLRYYWFRLSDVMLPLGLTFGLTTALYHLQTSRSPSFVWSLGLTLLLITTNVGHVVYEHINDPRPGAVSQSLPADGLSRDERMQRFQAWLRVCAWIRENTPNDSTFLTPRHQQTFQWYAYRSEVVSAKNFPQDAAGIVEWRRRLNDVFPRWMEQGDLSAHGEQRVIKLAKKYAFQYVVIDRTVSPRRLQFPRTYPRGNGESSMYEVYEVPK